MNMFEVVGYLAIVWLLGCIVFLPCYAVVWYFVSMKNNKIPMSSDSVWVNGVNIHHDMNKEARLNALEELSAVDQELGLYTKEAEK